MTSSNQDLGSRLALGTLEEAVRAADPAALLVLPRILRRVIKQDRLLTGFGLRVPHRKSYTIGRERLLEIVDRSELGLAEDAKLPETVILLARPDPRGLAATSAGDVLIRCWRLLFHARVHVAFDSQRSAGRLTTSEIRLRIRELGAAEFEEVRTVLSHEDLLLPPRDDASVYVEFVAVYLELRYFAGSFLPRYFPGLANCEAVDELIARDVDAAGLFQATRPTGAPDPSDICDLSGAAAGELDFFPPAWNDSDDGESESAAIGPPDPSQDASEAEYRALMRKSQKPAALGNVVRAAIYRMRALRCAPPELAARAQSALRMDIYRLIRRLRAALQLDGAEGSSWHESLFALVNQTTQGVWTPEARLLYDLQKACIDYERSIYTVDLVEWALSWGSRPIKRPLPNQRDALMLKHLGSAARLLDVVRLADPQRRQLGHLIHDARDRVEARLRERIRPRIVAVLDELGFVAGNVPERVARRKLVEELLDQIGERGFLTMGDLRDAISRNGLKLPDLSEPRDLLRGDQLLRADRKLSLALDGVYRRGEFYLRWMQRISSLGFGTSIGRLVTRFAVVPFGGAFVTVAFAHHVMEWFSRAPHPDPKSHEAAIAESGVGLTSPAVLILGLFFLCLVNSAVFRGAIVALCKNGYRAFHAVVFEPIWRIIQSPFLQHILHSRLFSITMRFGVKPLVWTGLAWGFLPAENWQTSAGMAAAIFLGVNLAINSRAGRVIEEVIADWLAQTWHRFGLRAIMGLFWLVVDVFKGCLETIERSMYAVDEWLRFRSGERAIMFIAKAGLGVAWFFVAYVVRFCVTVLIEPQINPIKHFPVVTVAHKLLLGAYGPFAKLLEVTMEPAMAWTVSLVIIWSIPGVFGFLVWELTANWRLYAANRRKNLFPVRIGSHGETMLRLLRPGFHSGTLPKCYAKLRRAERHSRHRGNWQSVRKHLQTLHHIEDSIHRFVDREFLELFVESKCWQTLPVTLEGVRLSTNGVRLLLGCSINAYGPLEVVLETESGWLIGSVERLGWAAHLPPHQREVLVTALTGLYKSTGVDLVRQQVESRFPPPMPWYEVSADGLVLWPERDEDVEVLYDLHEGLWIAPRSIRGLARRVLPTIERQRLVFGDIAISWDDWVGIWNHDVAGLGHPLESVWLARVLP